MFRLLAICAVLILSGGVASAQPQAPRPIQGPAATIEDRVTGLELRLERIERQLASHPAIKTPAATVAPMAIQAAPVMMAIQACSPATQAGAVFMTGSGDCGSATGNSYGFAQSTMSPQSGFRFVRPFRSLRGGRTAQSGCQ